MPLPRFLKVDSVTTGHGDAPGTVRQYRPAKRSQPMISIALPPGVEVSVRDGMMEMCGLSVFDCEAFALELRDLARDLRQR
jgi:hypothetical protein